MGEEFQLEKIFPLNIRAALNTMDWKTGLEEIRIRIGQPLEFCYDIENRYLLLGEGTCRMEAAVKAGEERKMTYRMGTSDIAEMLNYISHYSLYAYKEEMKQGYITIEGGHRIGLAGGVVFEEEKVTAVHHISFLNIRVAHEKLGCADALIPYLRCRGSIYNTLFLSKPGAGKTTYLRDSVRMISEGDKSIPGMKVCVVDERSEIAACHMGIPQNRIGPRTDVLDGCGKAEGMLMLLRSMSPQVLAVDELGGEKDFQAVEQAVYAGSKVLGTIHAGNIRELSEKPYLRRWIEKEVFRRYVLIERELDGKRKIQIYDGHMEKVC